MMGSDKYANDIKVGDEVYVPAFNKCYWVVHVFPGLPKDKVHAHARNRIYNLAAENRSGVMRVYRHQIQSREEVFDAQVSERR